jgi:hypothetical protein
MAIHNRIHWDIEQLRQLYEVEGKTVSEIGQILGRSSKVVNKACKRLGIQMRRRGPPAGADHPEWKGGVTTDKSGYLLRYHPAHPHCNSNGYVREHRLVMEKKLGRMLTPEEVVHHKDDDPANNHPDNLELFASNAEHLAATLKGKCPQWSAEGKAAMIAGARRKHLASLARRNRPDEQESCESSDRSIA